MGGGVISLLFFEIWFDWLPPYPASRIGVKNGYSVLSFIILYLFARAVRLYGLPQWFKKWSLLIYIGCSLTIAVAAHITRNNSMCFAYINPLVILSSLAFLIYFEKLKIQSKWVNHLSKSTLAVLLGHTAISFLYKKQFRYLYENFSGLEVVAYWALAIVIVFSVSIVMDQVRLLIYKPIESYMKKHIKQNEIFKLTSD